MRRVSILVVGLCAIGGIGAQTLEHIAVQGVEAISTGDPHAAAKTADSLSTAVVAVGDRIPGWLDRFVADSHTLTAWQRLNVAVGDWGTRLARVLADHTHQMAVEARQSTRSRVHRRDIRGVAGLSDVEGIERTELNDDPGNG